MRRFAPERGIAGHATCRGSRVRTRRGQRNVGLSHDGIFDAERRLDHGRGALPGADYVDLTGFRLCGNQFVNDHGWAPFFDLFDWPYTELTPLDPKKPILLGEWVSAIFRRSATRAREFLARCAQSVPQRCRLAVLPRRAALDAEAREVVSRAASGCSARACQ
jgi:hypothetical protein